jgi:hypothetical protein
VNGLAEGSGGGTLAAVSDVISRISLYFLWIDEDEYVALGQLVLVLKAKHMHELV